MRELPFVWHFWYGVKISLLKSSTITYIKQWGVYLKDPGHKFWVTVDRELEEIRKECAQPDRISFTQYSLSLYTEHDATDLEYRALNKIYSRDLSTYPPENQALLSEAHPTAFQTDMNSRVHQRQQRPDPNV